MGFVNAVSVSGANESDLNVWCEITGAVVDSGAALKAAVRFEDSRRTRYIEKAARLSDEKFVLDTAHTPGGVSVNIICSGKKSMFYALSEVLQRYRDGTLRPGETEGYPLFKVRGYIEGFYGKPWSESERLEVLTLMAKKRMNTLYYAPKDDVYHREKWRELYDGESLESLRALCERAGRYCVDFHYCIAPGLSIRYCDGADFKALAEKTQQLYSIGIRKFGLLLDDIEPELSFDADRERYGETVNAHIDLINRYYAYLKELDEGVALTVCPMLYNGRGNEYYISKLGSRIPADVSVFWTGRDICSREITSGEAIRFIENVRHKPLYWDNYPVNDCAMYNEMHLSPLINRDADLYRYCEGIISNCMEYARCSKIPLMSIADFLWDSENYDPELSYENAVRETVGEENLQAFMCFADHLYTSCLNDENSRRMQAVFAAAAKSFARGDAQGALKSIGEYLGKMNECCEFLRKELPICVQLRRWSERFFALRDVAEALYNYIASPSRENEGEIDRLIGRYEAFSVRLAEMSLRDEIGKLF